MFQEKRSVSVTFISNLLQDFCEFISRVWFYYFSVISHEMLLWEGT